jgi:hypothetical protein
MYLVPLVVFFSPHITWLHCMWNVDRDVGEVPTIWSRVFFFCEKLKVASLVKNVCILWNRKVTMLACLKSSIILPFLDFFCS